MSHILEKVKLKCGHLLILSELNILGWELILWGKMRAWAWISNMHLKGQLGHTLTICLPQDEREQKILVAKQRKL